MGIRDPGHYWRTTTLADLGCRGSGMPSWVVGPGRGPSAAAAAADLGASFGRSGDLTPPAKMTAVRADVGYLNAPDQTWMIKRNGHAYATAVVSQHGAEFLAAPDLLC